MSKRKTGTGQEPAPSALTPPGVSAEQHVNVSSITPEATAETIAKLQAEMADLRRALKVSEEKRSDAEKAALAAAEAQGSLMQREIQEVPTGKTVKVKRAVDPETGEPTYKAVGYKDNGQPILKPVFHDFHLPTYFYKIDIPAVGGMGLRIGEVDYYHGMVYELDVDTLRTVKEMVFRLWDHERNIHGNDENFYRPKQAPAFSVRTGARLR